MKLLEKYCNAIKGKITNKINEDSYLINDFVCIATLNHD